GAHDSMGNVLASTNRGGAYRTQGVLALGEDLAGANATGGLARASGSSCATALVSGLAALGWSVCSNRGIGVSGALIREIVLHACVPTPQRFGIDQGFLGKLCIKRLFQACSRGYNGMTDNHTPLSLSDPSALSVTASGQSPDNLERA